VNLRILADAEAEIDSAILFLNEQSPGLGNRYLDEVSQTLEAIVVQPLRFAKLETLPSDEPYRRALLKTFPYAVVFEVIEHDIHVVAVVHTSREPNYWLARLPNH
jgi:plasmid stabilization system protein ParE